MPLPDNDMDRGTVLGNFDDSELLPRDVPEPPPCGELGVELTSEEFVAAIKRALARISKDKTMGKTKGAA